jgi:hypothetical protein
MWPFSPANRTAKYFKCQADYHIRKKLLSMRSILKQIRQSSKDGQYITAFFRYELDEELLAELTRREFSIEVNRTFYLISWK